MKELFVKSLKKLYVAAFLWVIIVGLLYFFVDVVVGLNSEFAPIVFCFLLFLGFMEVYRRLPSEKEEGNE